ncbi:hypothetical protein [Mycolicibacter arupensis]
MVEVTGGTVTSAPNSPLLTIGSNGDASSISIRVIRI